MFAEHRYEGESFPKLVRAQAGWLHCCCSNKNSAVLIHPARSAFPKLVWTPRSLLRAARSAPWIEGRERSRGVAAAVLAARLLRLGTRGGTHSFVAT